MERRYGIPVWGNVKEEYPVVETGCGKVRGKTVDGVAVFRGIPYGDRCDGNRRFRLPRPVPAWNGVKDCLENGPIAVQSPLITMILDTFGGKYYSGGRGEEMIIGSRGQDENCLVLNVVTPDLSGEKLPVAVYIHGGSFLGGMSEIVCLSDQWAREEDIVVVGVNHRLNVFGFLDVSSLDESYAGSGCAGVMDILLALQWIRDNIGDFGGDPDQVTVMGESGGGMKINALLSMKAAEGLFRSAIIESGSLPMGTVSNETAAETLHKVMEQLGADSLDALQQAPARELYDAAVKAGVMTMGLQPVGDSVFLPFNKDGKYLSADIAMDIPLLVGYAEDEFGISGSLSDMTWEGLREVLLHPENAQIVTMLGPVVDPVCTENEVDAVIAAARESNCKGETPEHTLAKILSCKSFFGSGAYAQVSARAEQGSAAVYHYLNVYDAPNQNESQEKCAWHGSELPLQMRLVYCPECEPMSRMLAHSFAGFIRTGNPSTEEQEWPPFTTAKREVMVMDEQWKVEKDPARKLREALSV